MRLLAALVLVALGATGCYEQPGVPADRPLPCMITAKPDKDCPMGYACIPVVNVCAPRVCASNSDCPSGLACGRTGCGLPVDAGARPASEGGALVATPPDAGGAD